LLISGVLGFLIFWFDDNGVPGDEWHGPGEERLHLSLGELRQAT
jgi:hypothetical protein